MICKINGTIVNHSREFREQYPELFDILKENHYVLFVENGEYEDLIVFISLDSHKLFKMEYPDFEKHLKKENKFLFLNISKLFSEMTEGLTLDVSLINKDKLSSLIEDDYILTNINKIKKGSNLYIYKALNSEVGTTISVEHIKKEKQLLYNLEKYNVSPDEKVIHNIYDDSLILINKENGYVTHLHNSQIDVSLFVRGMSNPLRVNSKIKNIIVCDVRKFFISTRKSGPPKDFDYLIVDGVLYVYFLEDFSRFKTIEEASMFKFNERNDSYLESLKKTLNSDFVFYLSNGEYSDFILGIKSDKIIIANIKKVSDFNVSKTIEMFDMSSVIYLSDLGAKYITGFKREHKADSKAKEYGDFYVWVDNFEKQLNFTKK